MSEKTDLDFSVLENLDFDIQCEATAGCDVEAVVAVFRIFTCCTARYTSMWCMDHLQQALASPYRKHASKIHGCGDGLYYETDCILSITSI